MSSVSESNLTNLFTVEEVEKYLLPLRNENRKIGFVPTMGALHDGHMSLVKAAKEQCDVVVVSVFVNPTQFNNPQDLKTYPRQEGKDIELLEENECDFIFLPTVDVIYPPNYQNVEVDLGFIGTTMEGAKRPGHFDGVVNVVSRLFKIIQPDIAYFGRKDFQQVAVIREMNKQLNFPIVIQAVDTKREETGLAMSSRNLRLNEQERQRAVIISETLLKGKELAKEFSPSETLEKMKAYFSKGSLELEYLTIVHPDSLVELDQEWVPGATACIVAFCGDVRLIDNMELIDSEPI